MNHLAEIPSPLMFIAILIWMSWLIYLPIASNRQFVNPYTWLLFSSRHLTPNCLRCLWHCFRPGLLKRLCSATPFWKRVFCATPTWIAWMLMIHVQCVYDEIIQMHTIREVTMLWKNNHIIEKPRRKKITKSNSIYRSYRTQLWHGCTWWFLQVDWYKTTEDKGYSQYFSKIITFSISWLSILRMPRHTYVVQKANK